MAKINYSCQNCSHQFEGDDLTTRCPSCDSEELVVQKSNGLGKYKTVLVAIIGIVGLIWFLSLFSSSEDPSSAESSVSGGSPTIEQTKKPKINLQEREDGWYFSVENDFIGTVASVYNQEIEREIPFVKQDGEAKLLICVVDTGHVVLEFRFKPANYETRLEQVKLRVIGAIDAGANCPAPPLNSSDFIVGAELISAKETYKYQLKINRPDIDAKSILVSLNGEKGPYKQIDTWYLEDLQGEIFNMFFTNLVDTVEYSKNGDRLPSPPPPTAKVKSAAMAYASNPTTINAKRLNQATPVGTTIIYLDGKKMTYSEFLNLTRAEYNNDGQKFKLIGTVDFREGKLILKFARL